MPATEYHNDHSTFIHKQNKLVLTDSMSKFVRLVAFIRGTDNDGLASGVSAVQHNNNFATLEAMKRKKVNIIYLTVAEAVHDNHNKFI
jgi:hypothetical protein